MVKYFAKLPLFGGASIKTSECNTQEEALTALHEKNEDNLLNAEMFQVKINIFGKRTIKSLGHRYC